MHMLILGIDDAGRGPIIGPLILAGVLMEREKDGFFKGNGITDSKLLLHSTRIKLSKLIKDNVVKYHIMKVYPEEIDKNVKELNLNKLEAIKSAEIINAINTGKVRKEKIKVYIDCPSNNIQSWRNYLLKHITGKDNLEVICEHKADFNHPSVSAASILAKVTREEEMDKLRQVYKEFGNIGSGYPADPITQQFLKKNGMRLKDSGIFRKTWITWKALFPVKEQSTLKEFT